MHVYEYNPRSAGSDDHPALIPAVEADYTSPAHHVSSKFERALTSPKASGMCLGEE